jgi:hypothetical protein
MVLYKKVDTRNGGRSNFGVGKPIVGVKTEEQERVGPQVSLGLVRRLHAREPGQVDGAQEGRNGELGRSL